VCVCTHLLMTSVARLWKYVLLVWDICCKMSLMHVSFLTNKLKSGNDNMGNILNDMLIQGALYYYSIIIKINPASADAQNNLALIHQVFISLFFLNLLNCCHYHLCSLSPRKYVILILGYYGFISIHNCQNLLLPHPLLSLYFESRVFFAHLAGMGVTK